MVFLLVLLFFIKLGSATFAKLGVRFLDAKKVEKHSFKKLYFVLHEFCTTTAKHNWPFQS